MKVNTKVLNKISNEILADTIKLLRKVEKIDNANEHGNGYVQAGVLVELFAAVYNDPKNKVRSLDKIVIAYKDKN